MTYGHHMSWICKQTLFELAMVFDRSVRQLHLIMCELCYDRRNQVAWMPWLKAIEMSPVWDLSNYLAFVRVIDLEVGFILDNFESN